MDDALPNLVHDIPASLPNAYLEALDEEPLCKPELACRISV